MDSSDPLGEHRIFVGGVSWKVNDATLKGFFETNYGPVIECKLIMDKQTGNSKGYGFVTFASPETAANVKQLGSIPFMGKNMNVGDAYRKDVPSGRSGMSSPGGGGGMRMHQGGGRPGGLLDRPQGQVSSYGHMAPPPSQPAYSSSTQPQGGSTSPSGSWGHTGYQQQATGGYYDPYQGGGGGGGGGAAYYGGQWAQQQAAPAHQAQQVYGYSAPQQSTYGAYAGYQQAGQHQQQAAYSYPQQQQGWPQQQSGLQQQQLQLQQLQQQQMQQQLQPQQQQQAYGGYAMPTQHQ